MTTVPLIDPNIGLSMPSAQELGGVRGVFQGVGKAVQQIPEMAKANRLMKDVDEFQEILSGVMEEKTAELPEDQKRDILDKFGIFKQKLGNLKGNPNLSQEAITSLVKTEYAPLLENAISARGTAQLRGAETTADVRNIAAEKGISPEKEQAFVARERDISAEKDIIPKLADRVKDKKSKLTFAEMIEIAGPDFATTAVGDKRVMRFVESPQETLGKLKLKYSNKKDYGGLIKDIVPQLKTLADLETKEEDQRRDVLDKNKAILDRLNTNLTKKFDPFSMMSQDPTTIEGFIDESLPSEQRKTIMAEYKRIYDEYNDPKINVYTKTTTNLRNIVDGIVRDMSGGKNNPYQNLQENLETEQLTKVDNAINVLAERIKSSPSGGIQSIESLSKSKAFNNAINNMIGADNPEVKSLIILELIKRVSE